MNLQWGLWKKKKFPKFLERFFTNLLQLNIGMFEKREKKK